MMTQASEKALIELKAHYAKIDACFWQCEQWARRCSSPHDIQVRPDCIDFNIRRNVPGIVDRVKETAMALDEMAYIIERPEHTITSSLIHNGVILSLSSMEYAFKARPWYILTFSDMPECQMVEIPRSYTINKYICS